MAKVSLRAYNREIETMIDRGHLDEAVAHCQHILKTFPKHLETYRLLGKAFLEARRHGDAIDIFSRVLTAEPNDFVAHVGMSIIRDEQGKLDDAIWHMERAFEVQSANPAIQGELQRLYGRRDGVQPPRIRMTRGALAHMYMRGELYPQAISETKGVLDEDQGRTDMMVLRAKAYYRSGQKNDAADAASSALKRYPYCLDANLVLAQILGNDRPESAHVYRQRVIELDPYASQVVDNMFLAGEVSDAAVTLEHLEWNGQPVGMSSDWSTERAIGLESGVRDHEMQPDWLKDSLPAETPSAPSATTFASEQDAFSSPAQPADDIPDFLRAAGWGESSGSFDESKSSAMFADEPASASEPLAQGDLPEWVKAMAPQQTSQPAEEQEEEMPDWINKIGTGALAIPSEDSSSSGESDWLSGLGEPAASQPSDQQPDWMKGFGDEQPAAPSSSEEQPDWMKGFGDEQPAAQSSDGQLDWMKGFGDEQPAAQPSSDEQPDWMKSFGDETESTAIAGSSSDFDFLDELTSQPIEPAQPQSMASKIDTGSLGTSEEERDDSFAWLENLAAKQGATEGLLTKPEERLEDEPDWIKQAKDLSQSPAEKQPPVVQPPAEKPQPVPQPAAKVEDLGKSGQEIDDALAWFESLAAKQGATEGLLTKPEERKEQEPDWVKRVKSSGNAQQQSVPVQQKPVQQPPIEEQSLASQLPAEEPKPVAPAPQPSAKVEDLGKSGQEIDDALAWFESLAVKQGATEGLLTKPEERSEEEPEWVKQVKKGTGELQPAPATQAHVEEQPPVAPPPVERPKPAPVSQSPANVEDLGKSSQEIDDALAWFESLAVKQGATEGLLTKPEERLEQEPEWVKQVKKSTGELKPAQQPPVETPPPASQPAVKVEDLGKSGQEIDDALAWFESLAVKQGATEGLLTKPEERSEQEPEWVKQVKKSTGELRSAPVPVEQKPVEQPQIEEEEFVSEFEPAAAVDDVASWLKGLDDEETQEPGPIAESDTTSWLKSLDEPEETPITVDSGADDLPAWMQDVSGEEVPATESTFPMEEAELVPSQEFASEDVPDWLSGLEQEEQTPVIVPSDDLPAWMRDETGEVVAEPTKIEPTRSADWKPVDVEKEEPAQPAPVPAPVEEKPAQSFADVTEKLKSAPKPATKAKKSAPKREEIKPAAPPEPYKEPVTRRGTGMLTTPVDPILASARVELSRSNIPGALETYEKLIKKGRFLEEVIFDLREGLYRYPVEVSIWQTLGDAYMRANQLQDALDAYTKAEELLR